ncbi:hypothetical protein BKA64DRAFT_634015 [Cadophora sp. MPI-SDFR-AT-0126]|nr:hypothetical protein BKA64DRAFT_634015 [Leotiomycetes sp. MPI-SDFR-AT-0126]
MALEGINTCEDFNLESLLSDKSPSSEPTADLDKFILFPKLAAEIRLKIWAHAYANLKGRKVPIEPPLVKVPSLLQVCYDSRKLGLGIFTRQEHRPRGSQAAFVTVIDFE